MIREIRTAEQLTGLIQSGIGYLYNDFGGRDSKMCPIHSVGCRWIPSMLRPSTGTLGVPKLWSDDLDELVAEVEARELWNAEFAGRRSQHARDPAAPD